MTAGEGGVACQVQVRVYSSRAAGESMETNTVADGVVGVVMRSGAQGESSRVCNCFAMLVLQWKLHMRALTSW